MIATVKESVHIYQSCAKNKYAAFVVQNVYSGLQSLWYGMFTLNLFYVTLTHYLACMQQRLVCDNVTG